MLYPPALAPRPRTRPSRLLLWSVLATAALTALTTPALAGVSFNTIDRDVTLDRAGGVAEGTGPMRCSQPERARIRVTVSQRTTGAVAEGRWRGPCRRTITTWAARKFAPLGSATFQPGRAQACALAITSRDRSVTDAKQWCRAVRLAAAAPAPPGPK